MPASTDSPELHECHCRCDDLPHVATRCAQHGVFAARVSALKGVLRHVNHGEGARLVLEVSLSSISLGVDRMCHRWGGGWREGVCEQVINSPQNCKHPLGGGPAGGGGGGGL